MKTLCSAMRIELEHRHRHQLQVLHQAAEASKCVAELDVDKVKNSQQYIAQLQYPNIIMTSVRVHKRYLLCCTYPKLQEYILLLNEVNASSFLLTYQR